MEPAKAATPLHQLAPRQARMIGKIVSSRRHEQTFYTQVISPAEDEYSSPSKFVLRSTSKLGERDDNVNVVCKIGGAVRQKPYTDKKTGEQRVFEETNVYFDVID